MTRIQVIYDIGAINELGGPLADRFFRKISMENSRTFWSSRIGHYTQNTTTERKGYLYRQTARMIILQAEN